MTGATHFIEVLNTKRFNQLSPCSMRYLRTIINAWNLLNENPVVAIFYIREKTEQEKKDWVTLNHLKTNRQWHI